MHRGAPDLNCSCSSAADDGARTIYSQRFSVKEYIIISYMYMGTDDYNMM